MSICLRYTGTTLSKYKTSAVDPHSFFADLAAFWMRNQIHLKKLAYTVSKKKTMELIQIFFKSYNF